MPKKKTEEVIEEHEKVNGSVEGVSYTQEDQRIRFETRDRFLSQRDGKTYGTNKLSQVTGQIVRNRARMKGVAEETFANGAELTGAIDAYWCILFQDQENGVEVMPDVEHLADFLGVTRDTLLRWARGDGNIEFVQPIQLAFSEIATAKKQRAFSDKVNGLVYLNDMQNNHGYISNTKASDVKINVRLKHELPSKEQLIEQVKLLP